MRRLLVAVPWVFLTVALAAGAWIGWDAVDAWREAHSPGPVTAATTTTTAAVTATTAATSPDRYTASGEMTADETWWGEIRLTGSVIVGPEVTLTIEPGTVVTLAAVDDTDFVPPGEDPSWATDAIFVRANRGRLEVLGTAEQPVVFRPDGEGGDARQWGGLIIGSSSEIRHAELWYAGAAAVTASGGLVEHTLIVRPWGAGIRGAGTFADNTILEAGEAGIYCANDVVVRGNIIARTPTGIEVAGGTASFGYAVTNNLIVDSRTGIYLHPRYVSPTRPSLEITHNTIVLQGSPPWARFTAGHPADLIEAMMLTGIWVGATAGTEQDTSQVIADNVVAGGFAAPIYFRNADVQTCCAPQQVERNLTFGGAVPGAAQLGLIRAEDGFVYPNGDLELVDPGEVQQDPSFLDPAGGDYRLGAGSPAIDAGDPATADADGSPADLGAYGGPEPLTGLVPVGLLSSLPAQWRPPEAGEPAVNATTSGWMETDEIWRGEIRLTGSVLLAQGVTLTVEAGTRVLVAPLGDELRYTTGFTIEPVQNFDPAFQEWAAGAIVVDGRHGRIQVEGTAEQPVVFLPDTDEPVAGLWEGIVVGAGYLRHCDIGYAGIAAVLVTGPDVEVAHCAVHDYSLIGIDLMGASGAHVHHNLVTGGPFGIGPIQGSFGMFWSVPRFPAWTADTDITIEFNRVEASQQCIGVPVTRHVYVRHNVLRGCWYGISLTRLGYGPVHATISFNTLVLDEPMAPVARFGDLVPADATWFGHSPGEHSAALYAASRRAWYEGGEGRDVSWAVHYSANVVQGFAEAGGMPGIGVWDRNLYWKSDAADWGSPSPNSQIWHVIVMNDIGNFVLFQSYNIFGRARFVDPDAWDYRLAPGSPGVDAGYEEWCRDPDGSVCDLGAYGGSDAVGWDDWG